MDRRLQLQTVLENLMVESGLKKQVFFQPTQNLKMEYPAIVYRRDYIDTKHGDNAPYTVNRRYLVTYIDRRPDGTAPMVDKLAHLPQCVFDRFYISDGLNHDVFKIYF